MDTTTQFPPRMTTRQAADYLGLQPGTLDQWRSTCRYKLPYLKIGGAVRYDRSALDAFLKSNTISSPSVGVN